MTMFTDFGKWLEQNGVRFTGLDDWPVRVPFVATVDLGVLKKAVSDLQREARVQGYQEAMHDAYLTIKAMGDIPDDD